MKIKKSNQSTYQKKCCEENYVDLLLIGEEGKRHYDLLKAINTFMYDHTLYRRKKTFLLLLFKSFYYRRNVKDCFKINGKQIIIMPKNT